MPAVQTLWMFAAASLALSVISGFTGRRRHA